MQHLNSASAESCMPGGRYIDRWRRAKGDLPDTIVHETEANAFGGVQAHPECGYLGGHSYVSNPLGVRTVLEIHGLFDQTMPGLLPTMAWHRPASDKAPYEGL